MSANDIYLEVKIDLVQWDLNRGYLLVYEGKGIVNTQLDSGPSINYWTAVLGSSNSQNQSSYLSLKPTIVGTITYAELNEKYEDDVLVSDRPYWDLPDLPIGSEPGRIDYYKDYYYSSAEKHESSTNFGLSVNKDRYNNWLNNSNYYHQQYYDTVYVLVKQVPDFFTQYTDSKNFNTLSEADKEFLAEYPDVEFDALAGNDSVVLPSDRETYFEYGFDHKTMIGGEGDDTIDASGSAFSFIVEGGNNKDLIKGGTASDTLYGGLGDDTIEGGGGADSIYGGKGSDTVNGGDGDDEICGVNKSELDSTKDSNQLNGGKGRDRAIYADGYSQYEIELDTFKVFASGKTEYLVVKNDEDEDHLSGVEILSFGGKDVLAKDLQGFAAFKLALNSVNIFIDKAVELASIFTGDEVPAGAAKALKWVAYAREAAVVAYQAGLAPDSYEAGRVLYISGAQLLVSGIKEYTDAQFPGSGAVTGQFYEMLRKEVKASAGQTYDILANSDVRPSFGEVADGLKVMFDAAVTKVSEVAHDTLGIPEITEKTESSFDPQMNIPRSKDGSDRPDTIILPGVGDNSSDFKNIYFAKGGADNVTGSGLRDWISGDGGNDFLRGMNGYDYLLGGLGGDTMAGGAGNDVISGGDGKDVLEGGAGKDDLLGGQGKDIFVFRSASELGKVGSATDTIFDFDGDKIDLHFIDANLKSSGNQAFKFIGSNAFHGVAGELAYSENSAGTYIRGDMNGDRKADFAIHIADAIELRGADFIL